MHWMKKVEKQARSLRSLANRAGYTRVLFKKLINSLIYMCWRNENLDWDFITNKRILKIYFDSQTATLFSGL
jgi:hypothetical protein